jgi:hypothetical protein
MSSTKYVRVRPAHMGGPCAVRHPEHGEYVVPSPSVPYAADDPIVREYPWLFVSDDEITDPTHPSEVRVERATRAPGERRHGRRG